MRKLWFKAVYVGPILRGEKADTIRHPGGRTYRVGDRVELSVGPRRPFARAVVTAFDLVTPAELGDRLPAAVERYGVLPHYRRLGFKVVEVIGDSKPSRSL